MGASLKTLHICLAFDNNYLKPFFVLITSIFLNNRSYDVVLHVIANEVDNDVRKKITEYIGMHNAVIFFYNIDSKQLKNFPLPNETYISIAAYYRIFFPLIMPDEIERILYLDTDTLIVGDLIQLYEIEFDNPIAAVVDIDMPLRDDLGLADRSSYFNSGVLLILRKAWIAQKITEKASYFISMNPDKLNYPDQDALNVAVMDNWKRMDRRFNVMPADIPVLSDSDTEQFISDKVVLHYAGNYKPWALGPVKLRSVYDHYCHRFLQTTIGNNFSPSALENQITLILAPYNDNFIFLGFYLHLIWISEVSRLSIDMASALVDDYYIFDHSQPASQIYAERLAAYNNNVEAIDDLVSNVLNDTVSSYPTLTLCKFSWINLCKAQLEHLQAGGLNLRNLFELPNLINDKLTLNGDIRMLIFFTLNKVFKAQVTSFQSRK